MEEPTKRRFRFGLRGLFAIITAFAVLGGLTRILKPFPILSIEQREQLIGLTESQVIEQLGRPTDSGTTVSGDRTFDYPGGLVIDFRDGRCVDAYYLF